MTTGKELCKEEKAQPLYILGRGKGYITVSNQEREHLAQFISVIGGYIPLSRAWMKKGEYTMSKFNDVVATQGTGYPFVSKELKPILVGKRISFDVFAVRGPVTKSFAESAKRMREISTYYLDIVFDNEAVETYQGAGLEEQMTLSFTAGYEGRDKIIEALREDIEEGVINNALLIGDSNWYSLTKAD